MIFRMFTNFRTFVVEESCKQSEPGERKCVLKEIIMASEKQVLSKVEANEHFILVWQGGKCLWNVMCNNYHNRDERAETKNV